MKTVAVYASLDRKEPFEYFRYAYFPFRHPCLELVNPFQADGVGMSIHNPNIDWNEYELAIVFSHSDSAGSAAYIKQKNPNILIITIPEPTPSWLLYGTTWGYAERMKQDLLVSDLIFGYQKVYIEPLKKFFGVQNVYWLPCPINIEEYERCIDLNKRRNVIAATGHTNFPTSSIRSWKIIMGAKQFLNQDWKSRIFCAFDVEGTKRMGINSDEYIETWEQDTYKQISRLNECKIFVDDNTCAASGHMALEVACLKIPVVGSNGYLDELFPELSLQSKPFYSERSNHEIDILVNKALSLVNDESLYNEMSKLGTERLWRLHSYTATKKRVMELLENANTPSK